MKKISSSSSSKRNATSTGSETPKKKKNVKKRESNPSSSSSKRNDTPTGSKTPNKFTTDGDDEDELTFKMDWAMVESKIDGNRYFKAPPTNPEHRYVNKTIDTRDDKGVPVPVWWKMTQVLLTRKRMSDAPEDKRDSKLRDFYYQLATEGDDEETASQESATSELTLTPEVIEKKTSFLTETERKAAENKIMDAGPEGLQVEGLDCRVVYSLPTVSRTYGLFKLMFSGETGGGKFICAADSNCLSTRSVIMEEVPKCDLHKGEKIGFVLGQFTDGFNKKNDVVFHTIASFKFIDDNKVEHATRAVKLAVSYGNGCWDKYTKERVYAATPKLVEIEDRRLYFDDEYSMMKVYTARQFTTLLKMLLWPDTTVKIISSHTINFPNGAYKELMEEMNSCGLELRILDKVSKKTAKKTVQKIPFLITSEPGETIRELLTRGISIMKSKKDEVAVLYFVASPYIIYAGQALNYNVHAGENGKSDPVIDYNKNKGNHPDPSIVPLGVVAADDRYKWEFHLHMCVVIASLLGLKNCINPKSYTGQSHPLCINKQTNSSFLDENSWEIIHSCLLKYFFVDVYLGPSDSN